MEIMKYLDTKEGEYFSVNDLMKVFTINRSTISRQIKKILKREEYIAIIKKRDGVQCTLYYGVKTK